MTAPPLPEPTPEQPPTMHQKPPKRRGQGWLGCFGFLLGGPFLLIVPIVLGGIALFMQGPLPADKNIIIPKGASIAAIAIKLQQEGATDNVLLFRVAARLLANDKLQAGEYAFTARQSLASQVQMLRDRSNLIIRRFTVAEGLTSFQIAELLRAEPALSGDIPETPTEGTLLPETYHFNYGDSRAGLLQRMKNSQTEVLNQLWPARAENLPLKSPQEAVIAASLIEKETGRKAEERARVAAVFYNRLQQNIPLQTDPTVIYALTKGQANLGRALSRADLETASPYNTYLNAGLPPGPICNPGRASLEAALHPEANDYLYFVADGTGGHAFARNLAEHNKNVARWLEIRKQ